MPPTIAAGRATVDAILSTDVLEHLRPEEVPAAVAEMARVVRVDMWLKIATTTERNRRPLQTLHARDSHRDVHQLHSTVMGLQEWANHFRRVATRVDVTNDLLHVVL